MKRTATRKAASTPKAARAAAAKPQRKASVKKQPAVKTKPAKAAKLPAPSKPSTAKKPPASKSLSKAKTARPSPAREALKARAMKRAIERVIAPIENEKEVVEAYMRDLDHPFKAELEAVRSVILGASSKISERIKWNAPSFFYKADLAAFDPRATEFAHVVFLFPGGVGVPTKSTLLEGKAKDRREAKFHSLPDVQTKKKALEKLVKEWVALRDS